MTILGAPVTKSNHQRIFRGKGGRPFVAQSAAYVEWERRAIAQILHVLPPGPPLDEPVSLRATFFRARRTGDLGNYLKALCDVLERAGIVANDRLIMSFDGCRLDYDKDNPRVEFEVTPMPANDVEFKPADLSSLARKTKRRG
jgi:Holliday junction resolvase RusA-like endonuclease